MTTFFFKIMLQQELRKLNRIIDEKIEARKNYRREAQAHREILRKLKRLEQGRVSLYQIT